MDTQEIILTNGGADSTSNQLIELLKNKTSTNWGETLIEFDTDWGKGVIKTIDYNQSVTFNSWQVSFNHQTLLKKTFETQAPIDFIFLNSGHVEVIDEQKKRLTLNPFQNIIVPYRSNDEHTFIFKKNEPIDITFITLKPMSQLASTNHAGADIHNFLKQHHDIFFKNSLLHIGNFNLDIAEHINAIHNTKQHGIVGTLLMDGRINIILGLQLMELENFITYGINAYHLIPNDIVKIQKACNIITDAISEKITVGQLARKVQLTPAKLQKGFQVLHNKTVNEYTKEAKLQKACEYLKQGEYSVSEIVYKIGFNSRSYFSQIFSERFGILPIHYRQHSK